MIVECRQCNSRYRIDDNALSAGGGRVRCPKCSDVFFVSAPAQPTSADSTQVVDNDFSFDDNVSTRNIPVGDFLQVVALDAAIAAEDAAGPSPAGPNPAGVRRITDASGIATGTVAPVAPHSAFPAAGIGPLLPPVEIPETIRVAPARGLLATAPATVPATVSPAASFAVPPQSMHDAPTRADDNPVTDELMPKLAAASTAAGVAAAPAAPPGPWGRPEETTSHGVPLLESAEFTGVTTSTPMVQTSEFEVIPSTEDTTAASAALSPLAIAATAQTAPAPSPIDVDVAGLVHTPAPALASADAAQVQAQAQRHNRVISAICVILLLGGVAYYVTQSDESVGNVVLEKTAADVQLVSARSTLYPLRDHAPALILRGEVVNKGTAKIGNVEAVVDVMDGTGAVMATAHAPVGIVLDVAELAALTNQASLDATWARHRAASSAVNLAPLAPAPYMIVLLDPPAPVRSYAQRVRLAPALAQSASPMPPPSLDETPPVPAAAASDANSHAAVPATPVPVHAPAAAHAPTVAPRAPAAAHAPAKAAKGAAPAKPVAPAKPKAKPHHR